MGENYLADYPKAKFSFISDSLAINHSYLIKVCNLKKVIFVCFRKLLFTWMQAITLLCDSLLKAYETLPNQLMQNRSVETRPSKRAIFLMAVFFPQSEKSTYGFLGEKNNHCIRTSYKLVIGINW